MTSLFFDAYSLALYAGLYGGYQVTDNTPTHIPVPTINIVYETYHFPSCN